MSRYQNRSEETNERKDEGGPVATAFVSEALEDLIRRGAQEMLRRALEDEVDAFLGRARH